MMNTKKISRLLKEKRVEAGLSQQQVSKILGYSSPQFVSNWERELCTPPLEALGKLVSILKINNQEIIDLYLDAVETELRSVLSKSKVSRVSK